MTAIRTFVDTNVLVYAFDIGEPAKLIRAHAILQSHCNGRDLVVSTQVLQEFYVTVTRKLSPPLSPAEGLENVRGFSTLSVVPLSPRTVLDAIELGQTNQISLWDALILRAAAQARCTEVLSEDMQDGWKVEGLKVINPFRNLG